VAVSRWSDRHLETLELGLADGEQLLGAHRVVLDGAQMPPLDSADGQGADEPTLLWHRRASRPTGRAVLRHVHHARELGFELPGAIFVLGVSDQRLLLWRASTAFARPRELAGSMPLAAVADLLAIRRLGRVRIAVVLHDQSVLVARSLWGRGISDLATAYAAATGSR